MPVSKKKETNIDELYFKNITDFRKYLKDNLVSCSKKKAYDGKFVYFYKSNEDFVMKVLYPAAFKSETSNIWMSFWDSEVYDDDRAVFYEIGISGYDNCYMYIEYRTYI